MARPCELYFLRSYTFILSCAREGGGERLEGRSELSEVSEASELSDGERLVGTSSLCRDARSVRPSPLKVTELHVMSFYNGRTDRASLQPLLV